MKNKCFIGIIVLLIISIILSLVFINREESITFENPFYLEDKYYENNNFIEIDSDEINKLITDQESFVAFIYQPKNTISANFEKILNQFKDQKQINIYKIAFSSIKDTKNFSYLEHYPSFIIFNKGKMVDFLKINKKEDLKCYEDLTAFTDWFTRYVKIKDNSNTQENLHNQEISNNQENSNNQESEDDKETSKIQEENNAQPEKNNQTSNENQDIDNQDSQKTEKMIGLKEKALKDANIKKEKGKVNIYIFWGNGCPHCAAEQAFFNKIEQKYGSYYNLYKFEIWSSTVNSELMQDFAKAMKDGNVKGVPYTIIGEKTFKGFDENFEQKIMQAIEEQAKNNFDVYFDKIITKQEN